LIPIPSQIRINEAFSLFKLNVVVLALAAWEPLFYAST
jgi:hypothetical protein